MFISEIREDTVYILNFSDLSCEIWRSNEYEQVNDPWLLAGDRCVRLINLLLRQIHKEVNVLGLTQLT